MHPRTFFDCARSARSAAEKAPLLLCLILSVLILTAVPVFAGNDASQPGQVDPMSPDRRSLFRDNEGFIVEHRQWENTVTNYELWPTSEPPSYQLDRWYWSMSDRKGSMVAYDDWRPVAAASGHLEGHTFDSVVHAYFDQNMSLKVVVFAKNGRDELASITLAGNYPGKRSVDLDVGDLDNKASIAKDKSGNDIHVFYDEIVVANTMCDDSSGQRSLQVTVLKLVKDSGGNYFLQQLGDSFVKRYGYDPEFVAVSIGDLFNENLLDGQTKEVELKNEFAVAAAGRTGWTQVLWFGIDTKDPDHPTLAQHQGTELQTQCIGLDMTAGDFNADGQDELCIVYGTKPIAFFLLRVNMQGDQPVMEETGRGHPNDGLVCRALEGEIRVVSGLFFLDPDPGDPDKPKFPFNQRQIMVAYVSGDESHPFIDWSNYIRISIYDARELHWMETLRSVSHFGMTEDGFTASIRHIDLAVGNFVGHGSDGKAQSPTEQGLLSYQLWQMDGNNNAAHYTAPVFAVAHPPFFSIPSYYLEEPLWCWHDDKDRKKYNYRTAVAAPDLPGPDGNGDTWVLGTPYHAIACAHVSVDYYIQDPPKHADYLPVDHSDWSSDPAKWKIINVSAYDQFYSAFQKETETSMTCTKTSTSSWDIGGGASFSVEAGCDFGIAKASVESTTKFDYDYEAEESHYNKSYSSFKSSLEAETNLEDLLVYTQSNLSIWRYPVFNFATDDPEKPVGCYELVFPRDIVQVRGHVRDASDWFQPAHSRANLLSYPPTESVPDKDDIGNYSIDGGSTWKQEPINDPTTSYTYGESSSKEEVQWKDSKEAGTERSHNNTISESEEIKTKVSGHFEMVEASASTTFDFHNSNSWGGSSESESEETDTTGIKINIPGFTQAMDFAYPFNMAVYYSTNGALKVLYGADPGDAPGNFWAHYYGKRPDPGLNLPWRLEYEKGDNSDGSKDSWLLAANGERGRTDAIGATEIFLRKDEINTVTNTYDYLGMALQDGDEVRVCAVIHNYSLVPTDHGEDNKPLKVRFDYVPIDPTSREEIDPEVNRTTIATTDPFTLEPQGSKEVYVKWNTSGLWNKFSLGDGQYAPYRIYVVVDPDDDVKNEIHEWKDLNNVGRKGWTDDQGHLFHGNNEGWWPHSCGIAVLNKLNFPTAGHSCEMDMSLHEKSLGIQVGDQILDEGNISVEVGRTYPLRVHLRHSGPMTTFRRVLLYDADPSTTDKIIGNLVIFGAEGNQTWCWGSWTPKAAGQYHLHAVAWECPKDSAPGNAIDVLHVTVTDSDSAGGDGDSGGCFINILK